MPAIDDREALATKKRDQDAGFLYFIVMSALLVTLIFLVMSQLGHWATVTGIGGLILCAGAAVGGLLGFLFSVPRILSKDFEPQEAHPENGQTVTQKKRARLLASNTNLERISEWLTTMLVGVGLSQVTSIGEKFRSFSDFLASYTKVCSVTDSCNAGVLSVIGPLLLMFGIVAGFIFFYLYTRIYLSPLFQHVEGILRSPHEPGSEELDLGKPEVQEAAAQLASTSANPSMVYASIADNLSVNQSLDVILNLLYEKGGYAKAISLGLTLARTPATRVARYWFLMCAAHGQKHHAMLKQKASAEELKPVRSAVLDAARQAVRLDPKFKARLRVLIDPDSDDNDLRDFEKDNDLLRIIT